MKKLIVSLVLLTASLTAFAQTITYGVKAGVNLSKLTASGNGASVSTQSLAGFHVGGIVDFGFDSFSIQPALLFSTKGGKSNSTSSDGTSTFTDNGKITLNYLELPVNFVYKVPAGDGKVFFGAGPYIGYGLSGKSSSHTSGTDITTTDTNENVTFGSGDNDVKNPDYGVNFLAGYELSQGLTINAGYSLGLANLANGSNGVKTKNQVISFSLGYFFK
jgi:hypothetical protein